MLEAKARYNDLAKDIEDRNLETTFTFKGKAVSKAVSWKNYV